MSYGFKSFGQKAETVSLSIRSIIDGVELEKKFNTSKFKFMTTSVSGRGAVSYRTNSVDVFGRDGEFFRGQNIYSRRIVIKAFVYEDTNYSYCEGMSKLLDLIVYYDMT